MKRTNSIQPQAIQLQQDSINSSIHSKNQESKIYNLHKQSLEIDNWNKQFKQRKVEVVHLTKFKKLNENKRFVDILSIIEHYNKEIEESPQKKIIQGVIKQNLIYKIEQILNLLTHNTCDQNRQQQLICFLHTWVFQQKGMYKIYPQIQPKEELLELQDTQNLRIFINKHIPQDEDNRVMNQLTNSELASTMHDTQGFQKSSMNDQMKSSCMYMTQTQCRSQHNDSTKSLRPIKDDYKFKDVHQYNLNDDLNRYGRKTLLEMDIMASGVNSAQQVKKEKEYKLISDNKQIEQSLDLNQQESTHVPFKTEAYSNMYTKLQDERRPVHNKKEFNNYMPSDQMDYKISARIQKRTQENLVDQKLNQLFVARQRNYQENKKKMIEEGMHRIQQNQALVNSQKQNFRLTTENKTYIPLSFKSKQLRYSEEFEINKNCIKQVRLNAQKLLNLKPNVQEDNNIQKEEKSIQSHEMFKGQNQEHMVPITQPISKKQFSQTSLHFDKNYNKGLIKESLDYKQRLKENKLQVTQDCLMSGLEYRYSQGMVMPASKYISDSKALLRNPFAKESKKKKKKKKK